jgi:hypothetical protein
MKCIFLGINVSPKNLETKDASTEGFLEAALD